MAETTQATDQIRDMVVREASGDTPLARPVESVLGLFSPSEVDQAFRTSEWSVKEELQILMDIARGSPRWRDEGYMQPPSHRVRVEAIKEIRQRAFDALTMAGGVVDVQSTRHRFDANGNPITEHMRGVQMTARPDHVDAMLRVVEESEQELNEQDPDEDSEADDSEDAGDSDGDDPARGCDYGDDAHRLATDNHSDAGATAGREAVGPQDQ